MKPRLFYLLNQAQGQLYKQSDQVIQLVSGITLNQSAVLLVLDQEDGASLSDLKDALRINKSSIGPLVDRMSTSQLIYKKTDESDTRITRVYIDEKGQSKLEQIKTLIKTQNALLTDGFKPDEIEVIIRFLEATIQKTNKP